MINVCIACGKEFSVAPCDAEKRKRCSKACRRVETPDMLRVRFWSKVDRTEGCWLWTGATTSKERPYGSFWLKDCHVLAHHVAYELTFGTVPDGLWVLHRCDNPACVRPDHLFLGDRSANVRDMLGKGRGFFQQHPDKVKSGDQHWAHRLPDKRPRGQRHGMNTRPESRMQGEENGAAKLTIEQVRRILDTDKPQGLSNRAIARMYGVSRTTIDRIVAGKYWATALAAYDAARKGASE